MENSVFRYLVVFKYFGTLTVHTYIMVVKMLYSALLELGRTWKDQQHTSTHTNGSSKTGAPRCGPDVPGFRKGTVVRNWLSNLYINIEIETKCQIKWQQ